MTTTLRYPTVLFDWGDTVMRDYPERTAPMVEWETVEIVDDIADVLRYLHASGRRMALATSADISTEDQIRGALARVGVDGYFLRIFSFRNTNLPKGEAFYRHVLSDLNISASETLMVGDHFEKDVRIPNSLGMFAVWFQTNSDAASGGDLHITVHSMKELLEFFKSIDAEGKPAAQHDRKEHPNALL